MFLSVDGRENNFPGESLHASILQKNPLQEMMPPASVSVNVHLKKEGCISGLFFFLTLEINN
jgi:hypothetical protein